MNGPPPHAPQSWEALRRRNARRGARVLARFPRRGAWQERALDALSGVLASRTTEARASLLTGPGFRSWLAAAEEALDLLEPHPDETILFARVAQGPHLATLLPRQRLDAGFRARAIRLGRSMLDPLARRLVPLLMFRTAPGAVAATLPLDGEADGEEARAAGEIHAEWPHPVTARVPRGVRVRLDGPTVRLASGGLPAWRPRLLLPGSRIVLARRVLSTRRGLRPASTMPGLIAPLGSALALLERAWPEARQEVEAHTRIVVPLRERNTVSFSMPSRPGVSFINMTGKSLVDLADDLLHESAHHRLHLLEESGPLVHGQARGQAVLYPSPWRRAPRPVRGILHATYTFSYRAELLARLLRMPASAGLPRAWMRGEMDFERRALAGSLRDLADAGRRGLLTRRGRALCAALERPFA